MGGVAKSVTGAVKKTFSNPVRAATAVGTFGTSELARKLGPVPKAIASFPETASNAILGTNYGHEGQGGQGGYGAGGNAFMLDPAQMAADKASINQLGDQQFADTNKFIDQNINERSAARQRLSDALVKQSADTFQQSLPGTLEDLNSRHLLSGSGVGQEIARQQGQTATNIANQVGTLGAQDIDATSQARAAALSGQQGMQTGALQRGFSLEDFNNQARVAQQLGAQAIPPPPSGKANFGTVAQGVGALAPVASLFMGGGAGAAAGAALPALTGNSQVATVMGRPVTMNQTKKGK